MMVYSFVNLYLFLILKKNNNAIVFDHHHDSVILGRLSVITDNLSHSTLRVCLIRVNSENT